MNSANLSPSATFCGGEGFSDNYINCSSNPYDLRPAADIIVGAAHKMRDGLPEDTPLVILMGEGHIMPSHIALQQMVASRLLDHGDRFTFNFELPHNLWADIAKKVMKTSVPRKLYYDCAAFDSQGQAALSAVMGFWGVLEAPVSFCNTAAFCYEKGVATAFNDASRRNNFFRRGVSLNLRDPSTAAAAAEYNKGNMFWKNMDAAKPDSVSVRNLVMARHGLDYAREKGVRLSIQKMGLSHIFGDALRGFSYKESLCAHYRKAGAAVLPVFLVSRYGDYGLNVVPEEAYSELSGSVLVEGLAEDGFYAGESDDEKEFITEKIHKESGGELAFYDVSANRGEYQIRARVHAAEVRQAYRTACPSFFSL